MQSQKNMIESRSTCSTTIRSRRSSVDSCIWDGAAQSPEPEVVPDDSLISVIVEASPFKKKKKRRSKKGRQITRSQCQEEDLMIPLEKKVLTVDSEDGRRMWSWISLMLLWMDRWLYSSIRSLLEWMVDNLGRTQDDGSAYSHAETPKSINSNL